MARFVKTVSRGSRFNQIYIPKSMEHLIEVGDEVEVRLVRKRQQLFYSKGLERLPVFKEKLLKDVFSFLKGFDGISCIFAVGSFLTEKVGYNDIDIALITSRKDGLSEHQLYNELVERFNVKFHVFLIEEKMFENLVKICPLTKAMLSRFICDKRIEISDERQIDKRHLRFLLMMPYDLLEIRLNSRAFFDSLRRLVTVERFLKGKSLDSAVINSELEHMLNAKLVRRMKDNEEVEDDSIAVVRGLIRKKLEGVEGLLKDGEK